MPEFQKAAETHDDVPSGQAKFVNLGQAYRPL